MVAPFSENKNSVPLNMIARAGGRCGCGHSSGSGRRKNESSKQVVSVSSTRPMPDSSFRRARRKATGRRRRHFRKSDRRGSDPAAKPINMAAEPDCAKMYKTPPLRDELVAGSGGALENVVVYVSAGAPEESAAPSQQVQMVQKGCRFAPHVIAVLAGQGVEMVNQDTTSHNIHPLATNNREWNKIQPPGSAPLEETFARPEFIPVKCNIHPWMHSYIAVLKTSHFAVTGDNGAFNLGSLPPGKYTITAWHETLGTQTQEVTVTGSETVPVNFTFKAK
jgi:plastocyanin